MNMVTHKSNKDHDATNRTFVANSIATPYLVNFFCEVHVGLNLKYWSHMRGAAKQVQNNTPCRILHLPHVLSLRHLSTHIGSQLDDRFWRSRLPVVEQRW